MAQAYYGVNLGQGTYDVQVGSSTASTDIEVRVNEANVANRADLVKALEQIQDAIMRNPWQPV